MSNTAKPLDSARQQKRIKYFRIVVSLVLAIVLWGYVMYSENPTQTRVFASVPVEYLNADVLAERGLVLADSDAKTVSVTVEAKRSLVRNIKAEDISASIDLSSFSEGENYADVSVHIPSSVSVALVNPAQVRVSIDSIVSEDKDVKVVFNGTISDEKEAVCTDLSTEIVSVSGGKSAVGKVDHLEAYVPTSLLSDEEKTFSAKLKPVDKDGNEVDNVSCSIDKVTISAQRYSVKTVSLNVPTVGQLPDSLELSSIDAPSQVKIAGKASDIESISEISANAINLSEITASTEVELVADVTGSVRLSASQGKLTAKVTVKKKNVQTINYDTESIAVTGLADSRTISFDTESVAIQVSGTEEALSTVSSSDFTLSLDCTGLAVGEHTAEISVSMSDTAKSFDVKISAPEIKVTIS